LVCFIYLIVFFEVGHSSHMDEYGGDDGGSGGRSSHMDDGGIGEAAAVGATTTEVATR
jgi:hypothetical protein